jgi:hypothetical protein
MIKVHITVAAEKRITLKFISKCVIRCYELDSTGSVEDLLADDFEHRN